MMTNLQSPPNFGQLVLHFLNVIEDETTLRVHIVRGALKRASPLKLSS